MLVGGAAKDLGAPRKQTICARRWILQRSSTAGVNLEFRFATSSGADLFPLCDLKRLCGNVRVISVGLKRGPCRPRIMRRKLARLFVLSAFFVLLLTGVAKGVSAFGNARILETHDPLLGIRFRSLFGVVGGVEIVVAMVCLLGTRVRVQLALVLWLAVSFAVYRLGLFLVGYRQPCVCLGSMTAAIHLSPKVADCGMKIVLGYLLVGSGASLLLVWKQQRN